MFDQISKVAGIGVATSLALAFSASNALAFDFTFSFDDEPGDSLFSFPHRSGTVTGRLEGLNDNQNDQYPTAVFIDSAPASLGIASFPIRLAQDFQFGSGMDVLNGSIVDIEYTTDSTTDPALGHRVELDLNGSNLSAGNALFCYSVCPVGNGATGNRNGFSGATYSSATPVPFGVSTDLSLIVLGGLYGASRLRKKFTASK